ncbi:MAG TPA: YggS family pyridoxal phosphate-dependent enzyme [bacterium]|nr:YggS family pyridoxal phosphate-dependent enzyme [bacterium]
MQERIDLIKNVYTAIRESAEASGRDVSEIKLVAVSKTKPVEDIIAFHRTGIREFGENYVQEFVDKFESLKDADILWHFIGSLQRNKVKYIIDKVYMIHTVDSVALAAEIQKQAEKKNVRKVKVLLQVNVGNEPQKGGIEPDELCRMFNEISSMDRISVRGLMSIPPFLSAEELRPYHRKLYDLRTKVISECNADPREFKELSMGMSADFDVAIEEGATIIRPGSILFGERS